MKVFKLKADPTFPATVSIPMAGGEKGELECVFRHKDREALTAFLTGIEERSTEDAIFEILEGWSLPEAKYSRETLTELLQNHHAAGISILRAYLIKLTGGMLGNFPAAGGMLDSPRGGA